MIEFGRAICNDLAAATRREWLVTNGLGGFSAGTVAGVLTRRYHGLLVAALQPPLGRTLLVSALHETLFYDGCRYPLYSARVKPQAGKAVRTRGSGHLHIESFRLEGTLPVWTYAAGEALLEKRIWMKPGENTTYVLYRLLRGAHGPARLKLRGLVNYRDYHGATLQTASPFLQVTQLGQHGFQIQPGHANWLAAGAAQPFYLYSSPVSNPGVHAQSQDGWQTGFYLSAEAERGESSSEDHPLAGSWTADLHPCTQNPGSAFLMIASTEEPVDTDWQAALAERIAYEAGLLRAAGMSGSAAALEQIHQARLAGATGSASNTRLHPGGPALTPQAQLVLAADQFIARRPSPEESSGEEAAGATILAGFPWFSDWGRDTMISLPGLTLATGRPQIARRILRTFGRYVSQGMLPNRFPDPVGSTEQTASPPEYNTVDATLWYFDALQAYLKASADLSLIKELFPVLQEILDWHLRGTRYHIQVDPADGLLYAGEPGVQLTWMDVKIGDWVVTPRTGKQVEINALWYNAALHMADFARQLDQPDQEYLQLAQRARASFARFWNPGTGYLFDVLDGPQGHDPSLRPNQIFAVSLPHSPLDPGQQRAVVDICSRRLLTSAGLRSLSPDLPGYAGVYHGDRVQRDRVYHQGTVWGWLLGPFARAHWKVYRDRQMALSYLAPMAQHLMDAGLGSISEIFDGDPPHTPRGCFAQAWSVAETLRLWRELEAGEHP